MKMGMGHGMEYESPIRRFKRALDCDLTALESVLDRYAPSSEQKGWWPHKPVAPDPLEAYKICYELLSKLDPDSLDMDSDLTTARYIRKILAEEKDPSKILEIAKTLEKLLMAFSDESE